MDRNAVNEGRREGTMDQKSEAYKYHFVYLSPWVDGRILACMEENSDNHMDGRKDTCMDGQTEE